MVGYTSMAKCKALMGSAVKGLTPRHTQRRTDNILNQLIWWDQPAELKRLIRNWCNLVEIYICFGELWKWLDFGELDLWPWYVFNGSDSSGMVEAFCFCIVSLVSGNISMKHCSCRDWWLTWDSRSTVIPALYKYQRKRCLCLHLISLPEVLTTELAAYSSP